MARPGSSREECMARAVPVLAAGVARRRARLAAEAEARTAADATAGELEEAS